MARILLCLVLVCSFFSCSSESEPGPTQNNQQQQNGNNGNNDQGGNQGGDQGSDPATRLVTRMVRTTPEERVFVYSYNSDNNLTIVDGGSFVISYTYDGDRIATETFTSGGQARNRSEFVYGNSGKMDYYRYVDLLTNNELYVKFEFSSEGRLLRYSTHATISDMQDDIFIKERVYSFEGSNLDHSTVAENVGEDCFFKRGLTYESQINRLYFGEAVERISTPISPLVQLPAYYTNLISKMVQLDCITGEELYDEQIYTYQLDAEGFITNFSFDRFNEDGEVIFSQGHTLEYTQI